MILSSLLICLRLDSTFIFRGPVSEAKKGQKIGNIYLLVVEKEWNLRFEKLEISAKEGHIKTLSLSSSISVVGWAKRKKITLAAACESRWTSCPPSLAPDPRPKAFRSNKSDRIWSLQVFRIDITFFVHRCLLLTFLGVLGAVLLQGGEGRTAPPWSFKNLTWHSE